MLSSFMGQICVAQTNEFSFMDKTFNLGATKTIYNNLYCTKPFLCICTYDSNGAKVIDSLVNFLKTNPTLIIEIGCHMNAQTDVEYSLALSARLSAQLRHELIYNYDIDSLRIISNGYGAAKSLTRKSEVDNTSSMVEQATNDKMNSRTVLTIVNTRKPRKLLKQRY